MSSSSSSSSKSDDRLCCLMIAAVLSRESYCGSSCWVRYNIHALHSKSTVLPDQSDATRPSNLGLLSSTSENQLQVVGESQKAQSFL